MYYMSAELKVFIIVLCFSFPMSVKGNGCVLQRIIITGLSIISITHDAESQYLLCNAIKHAA